MRDYELLYIIKSDTPEEQLEGVIEKFSNLLTNEGATIASVDKWGKRKFAYEIDKKYRDGYYVLVKFNGPASAVDECERVRKIDATILRQMTTRVGE